MLNRIRQEPALLYATLAALLTLGAAFGLALGVTQIAAVSGIITITLAWLGIRPAVTPVVAVGFIAKGSVPPTPEIVEGSVNIRVVDPALI